MTDQKVTEYKHRRLDNIKRNNEMLAVLKIQSIISSLSTFNKRQRSSFISRKTSTYSVSWPLDRARDGLKLNTDATVQFGNDLIGIGAVIIQDDQGSIMYCRESCTDQWSYTVEDGEVLALREGLLFAKQNNIHLSYGYADLNVTTWCGPGGFSGGSGARVNTRTHPCVALGAKTLAYLQYTSSSIFSNSVGPDLASLHTCSCTTYSPLEAYSMDGTSPSSVRSIEGH
ncbi:Uncharacterized protein Fot_10542 [Forsythia ovata]|uniref:RNase H type-1 domain-containing protein n=1 Tax=Forsythia ovata TaxID=205694 RepID=A0ABD1WH48_9LAMI